MRLVIWALALILAPVWAWPQSSTTINVPITITHAGNNVTTFTMQNDSGVTLPAGTPVTFGQAFRYNDFPPGTFPVVRDAATHTQLVYQLDEISTWHENGGNSSIRHVVWAALLPNALANGAAYTVEFVSAAGTYSQSSHQPLTALCSGPASHALKIHLTDVRNQDDSVRDSGDATFTFCNNINTVGRDAPRHVRAGNVYDEYVISGLFVYTSGHQDPLLYAQCNVDIFTQANGTSPGDVKWVCHMHNSWENVAAGSTGNAGNPGPAGFTNDPQMISYRTEVDDGSADVLDWSNLDATVSSASNPIVNAATAGCVTPGANFPETVCLNIPSSTGNNTWYAGQATRVSSTGTPVGGLANNTLYYVWPSGTADSRSPANSQFLSIMITPENGYPNPMTNSQGSGTTTFSTRQAHWHWMTWQTLDYTGLSNWAPFGTTTRVTRKVYPLLAPAEQRYWEETGVIVPLNLSQSSIGQLGPAYTNGCGSVYEPLGQLNVIGGGGPGERADLGISSEWAAKAFITQNQQDWDLARLFTYGTTIQGYSTLLDESTGRISPMNNGSPTGPGGSGNGVPYSIGPFRNQINLLPGSFTNSFSSGVALPLEFVPNSCCRTNSGVTGGTGIDHMPSFDGFTYMVFGDRHFLDMIWLQAERDFAQQRPGPGPELGQGYYRDNNAIGPDSAQHHYWGLTTDCCQGRGSAWLTRDVAYGATFGADNSPEKQPFADYLLETSNYWPLFLAYRDGPGSTGYSGSIYPPDEPDTVGGHGLLMDTFVTDYVSSVSYLLTTWQRLPAANTWNSKLQRYYEGVVGRQLAGAPVSFYAIDFNIQPQISNGSFVETTAFGAGVGQAMNGVDASDFGSWDSITSILANGQLQNSVYTLTVGDTLKMIYSGWTASGTPAPIDQLPGNRWFTIMGPIDNNAHTYYLQCTAADHAQWPTQCPVAGQQFVNYTRGNVPISTPEGSFEPKLRLQFDPGPGANYADPNYSRYGGNTIVGLQVLGYAVSHAITDFAARCGPDAIGSNCYNSNLPSLFWDGTVVVPGLPIPINTVP